MPVYCNGSQKLGESSEKVRRKVPRKSSQKIIEIMQSNPGVTIAELLEQVGIGDKAIEKQILKLKEQNFIRRIGPAKGGYWEVVE